MRSNNRQYIPKTGAVRLDSVIYYRAIRQIEDVRSGKRLFISLTFTGNIVESESRAKSELVIYKPEKRDSAGRIALLF